MKKMLPYVFTIFFPYYMVLLICSLFSHHIMKYVFHDNFYLGILYLFILWVIALISVIVFNVKHLMKKTEAVKVASINMVIKIAQIPAYVFIFVACMSVDDIYIWDFYRFRDLRLCIHFFERTGRSICCDAMSRGGYSGKDRNGRLLRFAVCLLPGCCQFDYHVQESKS